MKRTLLLSIFGWVFTQPALGEQRGVPTAWDGLVSTETKASPRLAAAKPRKRNGPKAKGSNAKGAGRKTASQPPTDGAPARTPESTTASTKFRARREFTSGMGMTAYGLPGGTFFARMRFLYSSRRPLYVGPEISMTLVGPAYVFAPLGGAWYEFVLATGSPAHLILGAVAGPAFAHRLVTLPNESLALLGELGVCFEIDDLTTVHGQFRSGIVGGRAAFSMAMLIGFKLR